MAAAHIGASRKHLINILLSRQNELRIVLSKMSSFALFFLTKIIWALVKFATEYLNSDLSLWIMKS